LTGLGNPCSRIEAESADQQWKLAGAIDQWEATQARALSGGPWCLTGGFWTLSLEELAVLPFRDGFEVDIRRTVF